MSKEFEKDFELSMLFHAREVLEVLSLAGIFQKDSGGKYKSREVRIAFNAYCLAMNHSHDVLGRCKPDRHISAGMVSQFHVSKWSTVEELFAVVLKICNDKPVT